MRIDDPRTGAAGPAGPASGPAYAAGDDGRPGPRPPRASAPFMRSDPRHLLSLGFGTGLAPLAPGLIGSLFGWLTFVVLTPRLPLAGWAALIAAGFVLGVVATAHTARALGQARPRAIVWDHVVAVWIVMLFVTPATFSQQLAAFILFRLFDGGRLPPMRHLDRRLKGGFGIMFDDVVAAFLTLVVVATWRSLFPTLG
jgi:phosphatidylglycerophosphatase A